MYYVYAEFVKTGKTNLIKAFDSQEDAIHHIAKCYKVDSELCQLGEYYYYMSKH